MSAPSASHVYILGAGRSGTTLLSVLLGAHPDAHARGELLHLPLYWLEDRRCSCGATLRSCSCWSEVGARIGGPDDDAVKAFMHAAESAEKHERAASYLLGLNTASREYLAAQESIFEALSGGKTVIDESKFVARALALAKLERQRFRYIYLVRDCRGVLHSFTKKVQKPRSMLSASLYYLGVNTAAQLAVWTRLRGRAIKVRYEDLIAQPHRELARIGTFMGVDMSTVIQRVLAREPIDVGHLVSGNRLRSQGGLVVRSGEEWRKSFGWPRRLAAYLLCLPLQVLNGYRP